MFRANLRKMCCLLLVVNEALYIHWLKLGCLQFLCKCVIGSWYNHQYHRRVFLNVSPDVTILLFGKILQSEFRWHRMGGSERCGKGNSPTDS